MKTVFVKCTQNRRPEFSLVTSIVYDEGDKQKFVIKRAMKPAAVNHVVNMLKHGASLKNQYKTLKIVAAEKFADSVKFDYIKGQTIEDILIGMLENNDLPGFYKMIDQYRQIVMNGHEGVKSDGQYTPEFREVFGGQDEPEPFDYLAVTNVDIGFGNIVFDGESYHCIDYEWVFSFPVPLEFVLFRAINNFQLNHIDLLKGSNESSFEALLSHYQISEPACARYLEYDRNFQKYVCDDHYNQLKRVYLKKSIPIDQISRSMQSVRELEIAKGYIEKLENDLGEVKNYCAKLEHDINEQNEYCRKVEKDVVEVSKYNEKLVGDLQNTLHDHKMFVDRKESEIADFIKTAQLYRAEIDRLSENQTQLEHELNQTEKKYADALVEIDGLSAQLSAIKNAMELTSQRLSDETAMKQHAIFLLNRRPITRLKHVLKRVWHHFRF